MGMLYAPSTNPQHDTYLRQHNAPVQADAAAKVLASTDLLSSTPERQAGKIQPHQIRSTPIF
jgi:hypothetical protein